jgi:primosomal protein DnaI
VNPIGEVVKPWIKNKNVKSLEQQLDTLFKHPVVQEFSNKYPEVTRKDYQRYLGNLIQWVTDVENCKNCPGLEECPNLFRGHVSTLTKQAGYLDLKLKQCHILKGEEDQKKKRNLIRSHHISKDILSASFSAMEPSQGRFNVIEGAIDFCSQFDLGRPKKGLYLYGPLGVGKSYIAGAIVNELVKYNVGSYIVYVPELMREVTESINDNSLSSKLEHLKTISVLVLDDIGAEFLTPWKRDEVLGAILQYRVAEHLPTIYTSNMALDELEEHMTYTSKGTDWMKAKRIMERIRHYVTPFFVEGVNWREEKG